MSVSSQKAAGKLISMVEINKTTWDYPLRRSNANPNQHINSPVKTLVVILSKTVYLLFIQSLVGLQFVSVRFNLLRADSGKSRNSSYGIAWWRNQMETFSALLTLCDWNPPVADGFSTQRPVTRSFDVFFDLCLNKRLSKQSKRRWFETPSRSLWSHCNYWFAISLLKSYKKVIKSNRILCFFKTMKFNKQRVYCRGIIRTWS